jgi:hypothetical protein
MPALTKDAKAASSLIVGIGLGDHDALTDGARRRLDILRLVSRRPENSD